MFAIDFVKQVAVKMASDNHPIWENAILGSVVLDRWYVCSAFEAELWGAKFVSASNEFFFHQSFSFNNDVSQFFLDIRSFGRGFRVPHNVA